MPSPQANESDPLLSGSGDGRSDAQADKAARNSRLRELGLFAWALIATAAVIVVAIWTQHEQQTKHDHNTPASKRNLVFMVSDGMGPAPLSLTRSFRQHVEELPFGDTLTLDKHFWGTSRTRSSSSLVTDSAAGATAFSCGKKTYNGAISTLPSHDPCGTVLEAAKRAGYHTGLVVTTKIEDATPACFNSHVVLREMEDEIALQQIGEGVLGRTVDLMLGGGRCNFLPNSTEGSCRADDTDVIKIAKEKHNWTYTDSRAGFDALKGGNNVKLPFLGLFAPTDIPFEIDRRNHNDVYPSLSEMAKTALRALEKATEKSDKGFFIMIEGSRIDHAGHINDPAAQVHEVLEYDKTFQAVLDFIKDSKTETVLVATSDHETGGLATAIQEPGHLPVYNWYPKALANATASAEWLHAKLNTHLASDSSIKKNKEKLKKYINEELIVRGLGISNASDKEITTIADHPESALVLFSALISLRAHVGWSTHGHTAVDVNIYSSGGPGAESIRGNVENTDVGKYLREYLEVDVDAITSELKEKMSKVNVQDVGMEGLDEVWSLGNKYHAIEV
ncbi:alkaline phosphatase [Fusarium oxysporum f. sp. pisi HDV247]|uniref:Alkaline phosphatase n=1 Tax=Fusarium oxysporum f. sp. pisi HDV247 TaxID=1080344 RepID=W9NYF6_FUSOX|nr:alkaline phosphatase [Fusarium oxysporum f. sp. pisi HDV247]